MFVNYTNSIGYLARRMMRECTYAYIRTHVRIYTRARAHTDRGTYSRYKFNIEVSFLFCV